MSIVVEMPNQIPNAKDIWRMIAVRDKPCVSAALFGHLWMHYKARLKDGPQVA